MRKLVIAVVGMPVGGLLTWLLMTHGVSAEVTGAMVPGVPVAAAALDDHLMERRKTRAERIDEVLNPRKEMNPFLVVLYMLLALEFLSRILGALVGMAMGIGLGAENVDTNTIERSVARAAPIVVGLLMLVAVALAGRWAAHRIQTHALRWVAGALAVQAVVDAAGVAITIHFASALDSVPVGALVAGGVLQFAIYFLVALVGVRRARREQRAYVMGRLYRRLSQPDQVALLDLVQTLPGVAAPS